MKWFMLSLLVVAAGCQTKTVDEMSYTERKELLSQLSERCAEQGISAKSPEYMPCMKAEFGKDWTTRQQNRRRLQGMAAGLSQGMQNMSNSYGAAAQNTMTTRQTTCRTQRLVSGTYSTTCY